MSRLFSLWFFFSAVGNLNDGKSWQVKDSSVRRIYDEETNVVCYVVPAQYCNGDCAYSPAISCVKVK